MKRSTRLKIIKVLIIVPCALLLIAVAMLLIPMHEYVEGEGFVTTDDHSQVRPQQEGPIKDILVKFGDHVEKGQTLLVLVDDVQQANYQKAKMELARAQTVKIKAEMGRDEAQKRWDGLKVSQQRDRRLHEARKKRYEETLEVAKRDLARIQGLTSTGAASPKDEQDARSQVDIAQARLDEENGTIDEPTMEADLTVLASRVKAQEAEILTAEADIHTAEAEVKARQVDCDLRKIVSPLAGTFLSNKFVPGEVVETTQILGEVFDDSVFVVKAKLVERSIRRVQQKDAVLIELASHPWRRFGYLHGQVKYSPLVVTPQRTGDGIIITDIALDPADMAAWRKNLIPGLGARIRIDVGRTNLLYWLMGAESD